MFEKLWENYWQTVHYSKEFRIAAPRMWDLDLKDVMDLLQSAPASAEAGQVEDKALMSLTIDMGTTFWRLQKRLTAGGEVPQEAKRILRDLESIGDALRQAGIEVVDHTGQKFDSGMAVKALTFQPMSGLTGEIVIETIKPTIYSNSKLVQMGEVIVGRPEKPGATDPVN